MTVATRSNQRTEDNYFTRLTGLSLPEHELSKVLEGESDLPSEINSMKEITANLREVLGLTQEASAHLLGLSRGTLLKDGPPSRNVLDELYALSRSLLTMSQVLSTPAQTLAWFKTPHPALDGETPLDKFRTRYGQEQVNDLIDGLLDGNFL